MKESTIENDPCVVKNCFEYHKPVDKANRFRKAQILCFVVLVPMIHAKEIYKHGTQVIVSQYDVNIYSEPSENSEILTKPYRGDIVTIIDTVQGFYDNHFLHGYWCKVKTNQWIEGWIFEFEIYRPNQTEDQLIEKLKSNADPNAIFQLGIMKSKRGKQTLLNVLGTTENHITAFYCIEALGTYRDRSLLPIFINLGSPRNIQLPAFWRKKD